MVKPPIPEITETNRNSVCMQLLGLIRAIVTEETNVARSDMRIAEAFVRSNKTTLETIIRNSRDYLASDLEYWRKRISFTPRDIGESFRSLTIETIEEMAARMMEAETLCRDALHFELTNSFNESAATLSVSEDAIKIEVMRLVQTDLSRKLPLARQFSKDESLHSGEGNVPPSELLAYISENTVAILINLEKPGGFIGRAGNNVKRFKASFKVEISMIGAKGSPRSCRIEAPDASALMKLFKDPLFRATAQWQNGLSAKKRSDPGPFKYLKISTDAEVAEAVKELASPEQK